MLATRASRRIFLRRASVRSLPDHQQAFFSSSSSSSRVYTWGNGNAGELGHGDIEKEGLRRTYEELVPKEMDFFNNKKLKAINFGRSHGAAVTEDGHLYTWGSNEENQCGLNLPKKEDANDKSIITTPSRVQALDHVKIVDVSCSEYATAALDSEGRVFTWGWGGSFFSGISGLGHGNRESQALPKLVETFTQHVRNPVVCFTTSTTTTTTTTP